MTPSYTSFAIPGAPNWWPPKLPGATLDYTLDVSCAVDTTVDIIQTVSAAIAPSGAGEMVGSNLTIIGDTATMTMTGGQPGRIYSINMVFTMFDNRIFEFLVYQGVPPALRGYPPMPPPSPGFGTPLVWVAPPSFDFRNPNNSGYIALLGGHG